MEIVAQNVFKTIGNTHVLNDLSLNVKSSEIYGLIGPNGAGKTTFIRSLLGIYEINSGSIAIDGIKSSDKNFIEVKYKIGCVMDHLGIYKDLTAWENLEFFYRIYFPNSSKNSRDTKISEMLKKVNIFHKKDEKITFFSKGQKQRLALARALMTDPKLLILDEPTVGLDVEGIIMLREYIQKIRDEGTTVFISSHNLDELQKNCDSFGFIKDGHIVKEGSLQKLEKKCFNGKGDAKSDIESIYKKIFGIFHV